MSTFTIFLLSNLIFQTTNAQQTPFPTPSDPNCLLLDWCNVNQETYSGIQCTFEAIAQNQLGKKTVVQSGKYGLGGQDMKDGTVCINPNVDDYSFSYNNVNQRIRIPSPTRCNQLVYDNKDPNPPLPDTNGYCSDQTLGQGRHDVLLGYPQSNCGYDRTQGYQIAYQICKHDCTQHSLDSTNPCNMFAIYGIGEFDLLSTGKATQTRRRWSCVQFSCNNFDTQINLDPDLTLQTSTYILKGAVQHFYKLYDCASKPVSTPTSPPSSSPPSSSPPTYYIPPTIPPTYPQPNQPSLPPSLPHIPASQAESVEATDSTILGISTTVFMVIIALSIITAIGCVFGIVMYINYNQLRKNNDRLADILYEKVVT